VAIGHDALAGGASASGPRRRSLSAYRRYRHARWQVMHPLNGSPRLEIRAANALAAPLCGLGVLGHGREFPTFRFPARTRPHARLTPCGRGPEERTRSSARRKAAGRSQHEIVAAPAPLPTSRLRRARSSLRSSRDQGPRSVAAGAARGNSNSGVTYSTAVRRCVASCEFAVRGISRVDCRTRWLRGAPAVRAGASPRRRCSRGSAESTCVLGRIRSRGSRDLATVVRTSGDARATLPPWAAPLASPRRRKYSHPVPVVFPRLGRCCGVSRGD
jgi:hypothetical protein